MCSKVKAISSIHTNIFANLKDLTGNSYFSDTLGNKYTLFLPQQMDQVQDDLQVCLEQEVLVANLL